MGLGGGATSRLLASPPPARRLTHSSPRPPRAPNPTLNAPPHTRSDMMSDWGHNFDTVIPELLAAGVRVLVYVGDQVRPAAGCASALHPPSHVGRSGGWVCPASALAYGEVERGRRALHPPCASWGRATARQEVKSAAVLPRTSPPPPVRPPQDFICNWVGNRAWVDVLPWPGAARWAAAQEEPYMVDGEEVRPALVKLDQRMASLFPKCSCLLQLRLFFCICCSHPCSHPCPHAMLHPSACPVLPTPCDRPAPMQAGSVTTVDALSFLKVYQAGHMVRPRPTPCHAMRRASLQRGGSSLVLPAPAWPCCQMLLLQSTSPCPFPPLLLPTHPQVPMDQPKHALDMITRFTRGLPLSSGASASSAASGGSVKRPQRLLPGATWQLRRAMPDREASLAADSAEQ